jgi:hypothetical protein
MNGVSHASYKTFTDFVEILYGRCSLKDVRSDFQPYLFITEHSLLEVINGLS